MSSEISVFAISASKYCLCILFLASSVATASALKRNTLHDLNKVVKIGPTCFLGPYKPSARVLVTFAKGGVFDQEGLRVESGSTLSMEDIVVVENNGFASIRFDDGRAVHIQPGSTTSMACALRSKPTNVNISQPYTVGGVRG